MGMRTRKTASIALAGFLVMLLPGARHAVAQHTVAQQGSAEATSQAKADAMAWLRYMADEVRKLRRELHELRLEIQESRTPELERELLVVQAERQRLEQEVSVHSQEISGLDRQLVQPTLPAEEQQPLLARRAELSAEVSERLRIRQDSLNQREAAARERIGQQQRRVQATLARSAELLPAHAQD